MRRRPLALGLLLCGLACGSEEAGSPGIQTRVLVDRTDARVGAPIGVTVEIETPPGFSVRSPAAPPPDERFLTDSVELLEPLALREGTRHRLLWTLRPRDVGDHELPELAIPLVRPDGHVGALRVGGTPLRVESVREELPEREVVFDIRPPPEEPARLWLWVTLAGSGLVGLALVALLVRRRRSAGDAEPDLEALVREALSGIAEIQQERDPRRVASGLTSALTSFAARRWGVETAASTPGELPEAVDARLVALLDRLERARFERQPERDVVAELAGQAREFFERVGRR